MSRRPRSHSRALALLLASALVAAACGSTVQTAGSDALGGGMAAPGVATDDGMSAPVADEQIVADADAPGGSSRTTTVGGSSAVSGSVATTATGGGTPRRGPAGSVPVGPGVTASEIALGIPYCRDCAAGNAALGAGGEDPGDERRYYRAVIDDVNARGGVLGRKLVPVFHGFSANDSNVEVVAQAACETFTKDNQVLIMTFRGDVAYECAKKAGILVTGTGNIGPTYQEFPNLFAPSLIRLERMFEVTVRSMVKAGWHKPSPPWPTGKIGLITWDDAEYRYAMKHGYLKGMRDTGLKATDVRYIKVPDNVQALGDASAAISNAVLRFREQGIDHVFIGDGPAGVFSGTGLTLLFLQSAKSQGYYPRYGFNSYNSPDFPQHPQDQLVGMVAIDFVDNQPANDQGIAPNQARERCFALMRKKGLPVGQNQTQNVAAGACEFVWFAEAAVKQATAGTTLPYMIQAAESLGTNYRSPTTYGTRLSPTLHDGARLFRELRYDESCSCIKYTSKPFEP